ncbi:MAG: hypothetical protein ABSG03_05680 [Bryobacteraceae bacterium]|jgi:hypothetical protein
MSAGKPTPARTVASDMVCAGISLPALMQLMGHAHFAPVYPGAIHA